MEASSVVTCPVCQGCGEYYYSVGTPGTPGYRASSGSCAECDGDGVLPAGVELEDYRKRPHTDEPWNQ